MTTAAPVAPATPLPDLSTVPFARGYVERLTPVDWSLKLGGWSFALTPNRFLRPRGLNVAGWALLPDGPFEKIAAYVDGRLFFTCFPFERPDVAAAFPHVPNSGKVGFAFHIPAKLALRGKLAIVGRREGKPAGKMLFSFRDDLARIVPTPPAELTNRVVYTKKPHFFLAQGYKSFGEIRDALLRHKSLGAIHRLLDWGCGCGRLTAHWLRIANGPAVFGCDIDEQAIRWCRRNLRRGHFETVNFAPLTPYPDEHFGAAFGYSVFTHLTRDAQVAWLGEMHRILAPGGVLVATVHGPSAAYFEFGPQSAEMLREGVHDATVDCGLDFLLGQGVYRNTYQTPEWTRATFDRYFEVLEYGERAIGNNQDLVVLRNSRVDAVATTPRTPQMELRMTTATAPATLPDLSAVPFARGYFDQITPLDWKYSLGPWSLVLKPNRFIKPRALLITGWLLRADGPFDWIAAYVNGQEYYTCIPSDRPDVAKAFPFVPNAGKCFFAFKLPAKVARRGQLAIVGRRKGRPVGKMFIEFRDDLPRLVPVPPKELTHRVVYTDLPHFYLVQGYKSFCEIRDAVARHIPLDRVGRLLDWGCGCGRLSAHWLRQKKGPAVFGCDIDPQAIEWCRGNLRAAQFETVNFAPPTPYPDGHFGAVFGYSVFARLARDAQVAWLSEMHRILRPGGILVATVHGPSAAFFHFGPQSADMLRDGIHDGTADGGLDYLLGQGVYRTTYQTEAWTRATFGRLFDVIEYGELAVGNNQDLVVLRNARILVRRSAA